MDKEYEVLEEHEALVILTRLVEHLRKQYLPLPVNGQKVLPAWIDKAADSIERYLNTPHPKALSKERDAVSLDAAFGLESGQGRPSKDAHREYIGRKAITMRRAAMSWKEIVRKLEDENIYLSDRTIRDYAKEFALQVMIEDAAESIVHDLINGEK